MSRLTALRGVIEFLNFKRIKKTLETKGPRKAKNWSTLTSKEEIDLVFIEQKLAILR